MSFAKQPVRRPRKNGICLGVRRPVSDELETI
jgi:hypothetical protein